jgi:hypothetical protein
MSRTTSQDDYDDYDEDLPEMDLTVRRPPQRYIYICIYMYM